MACLGMRGQADRLQVKRFEDLTVRGIAGLGHANFLARFKQCGERQKKRRRGARRDHHALWIKRDAIPIEIQIRDALAQLRQAHRDRVA